MTNGTRPLSPHLQVYRPQITSLLSILHRATGVFLAMGLPVLSYWVSSAAYGPGAFSTAQAIAGSWIGQLALIGWTFCLFYHMSNGIRHLAWDIGWGFDLPTLRSSGVFMVAASVVMTAVAVLAAYSKVGG